MAKTFRELEIGDEIFYVYTGEEWEAVRDVVRSIKEIDMVYFIGYSEIPVPFEDMDKSVTYEGELGFITTDREFVENFIKNSDRVTRINM